MGAVIRERVDTLKARSKMGGLIPLSKLVNHRSARGYFDLGSPDEIDLAYSEAWSLVHFLMQPPRREAFSDYIRYVRDKGHFKAILKKPRYLLLSQRMGYSEKELEAAWLNYLQKL